MSFSSHARCDRCESVLVVADSDELLDEGWLTVEFGGEALDFCSLVCVERWAGSDEARECVEAALSAEREDED